MSQSSAPADGLPFPDDVWRALFTRLGDGILDDRTDPTLSYVLTKPTGSGNDVQLGTGSSAVAGFYHSCSGPEPLTIPAVTSGAARTDVITVRYDPTFTTGAFPCRLFRVAGTPGVGTPAITQNKLGAWDLPLYNITRSAGQALSAAVSVDRRIYVGGAAVSVTPDSGINGLPVAPVQPKPGRKTINTDSGGRITVNFDTPFPTACHAVEGLTLQTTGGGGTASLVGAPTRTGFVASIRGANGAPYLGSIAATLSYCAWGN